MGSGHQAIAHQCDTTHHPQVGAQCLEVTWPHRWVPSPPACTRRGVAGHTCAQQHPPRVLKGELGYEVCFSPKGVGTHPFHQQQLGTAATPPLPNSICRKFTNGTSQSRASAREAAAEAALGAPGSATVLFPDLEMQAYSPCKLGSLITLM